MRKKILIPILFLLLISCTHFEDTSNEEGSKNLFGYSLENSNKYEKTDEIYTKKKLPAFQNEVKSKDELPYTKKELNNLDYTKEVNVSKLNFRIPKRTAVFKDKDNRYIDFPIASDYQILIKFNALKDNPYYNDEDSMEDNLLSLCDNMAKKSLNNQKLISPPLLNKSVNTPSAYFITEGNRYRYTHFLVSTPTDIIHFTIYEDKALSSASDNIMSDILKSMYVEGEDPMEVIKDFGDYKDELSIYATKDFKIAGIDMKLPENLNSLQDKENLKAFIQRYNNIVIQEIIIRVVEKNNNSIEDAFNENSGTFIYPAEIITKNILYTGKVNDYDYIRTKARIYMNDYTLEGDKITIETEDDYVTILIFGPINNGNSTNIMSTSIINSIK